MPDRSDPPPADHAGIEPLTTFVLPLAADVRPAVPEAAEQLLRCCRDSLRDLDSAVRSSCGAAALEAGLGALSQALWQARRELGRCSEAVTEPATAAAAPADDVGWREAAHDDFFHIARRPVPGSRWLEVRLHLFEQLCTQLRRGLYSRATITAVLAFMGVELAASRPGDDDGFAAAPDPGGIDEPTGVTPALDPMTTWVRSHHFLAVSCFTATQQLDGLLEVFDRRGVEKSVNAIRECVTSVNAIAASYSLAGEFSLETYRDGIRPQMVPPFTAVEMNGSYNVEYRGYARSWQAFADGMAKNRDRLLDGEWPALLIPELDALYLAIVMEAHEHVGAAWRLVGRVTALHQDDDATENAVLILQRAVSVRLEQYRSFIGA